LLDEIEKAHQDIFNILLQVMDGGILTDSLGRKAHCENIILIMTSNVGSDGMFGQSIGFRSEDQSIEKSIDKLSIEKAFRPEFRNRLDAIIEFNPLSRQVMEEIVTKEIHAIEKLLEKKKIRIALSPEAKAHLATIGFSPKFGARELKRIIQKEIQDVIADEILFGELQKGGIVSLDLDQASENKLVFTYKQYEKPKKETL